MLLEYIINQKYGQSKQNFSVKIINVSFMFQVENNHNQAAYVRRIKRNHILLVYILLKVFSRYFGLHINVYDCYTHTHTHKHLQLKQYCIKLNN